MPCKYLEMDLACVVRCSFTDNRVCKQWINGANLIIENNPYRFCERQPNSFIPAPVGDSETYEKEIV